MDGQKGIVAGRHADGAPGAELGGERHTVATRRHDSPDLKGIDDAIFLTLCFGRIHTKSGNVAPSQKDDF